MTDKLHKYSASYARWQKHRCDLFFLLLIAFVSFVLSKLYSLDFCSSFFYSDFNNDHTQNSNSLNNIICFIFVHPYFFVSVWLILSLIRIPFLIRGTGPFLKMTSIRLVRIDSKKWTIQNAIFYSFIEWFPLFLGFLSLLFIKLGANLFNFGVYFIVVLTAQIIWLASFFFTFKGKNLAEILSGVTVELTEKKQQKVQTSHNNEIKRRLNKTAFGLNYIINSLFVGFLIFLLLQVIRTPQLNPEYHQKLYSEYEPIWDDNIYFSIAGLSAPANVSDFYQYGLRKTYERNRKFEQLKRSSGVAKEYLHDYPNLSTSQVVLNEDQEMTINYEDWKHLFCLFIIDHKHKEGCATFDNWREYIEQNKIMWDRFNRVPDMGNIYAAPQQLLGDSDIGISFLHLASLKFVHIIYLAENGQGEDAINEWLKYMQLYKHMAKDRDTLVFKSVLEIILDRHINVLEKMLLTSPSLASEYKSEILLALQVNEHIFRDPYILSDDWGLLEPALRVATGNVNAVQNDILQCFQKFEAFVKENNLQNKKRAPCQLYKDKDSINIFYSLSTPGFFPSNAIHARLFSASSEGSIIYKMQMFQVRLKQAQLAVTLLSKNIPVSDIDEFLQTVPLELQNPITKAPFDWDEDIQSVSFASPFIDEIYTFRIKIGAQE